MPRAAHVEFGPKQRNLDRADSDVFGARRHEQVFDLALRHGDDRSVVCVWIWLGNGVVLEYPSVGSKGLRRMLVGPHSDPHQATRTQDSEHLGDDGVSIRHELKPLLAERRIDTTIGQGQMVGGTFERFDRCPIIGCFQTNSSEHERADVRGDHRVRSVRPSLLQHVPLRTGACGDIEYDVSGRRGYEGHEFPSPVVKDHRLRVVKVTIWNRSELNGPGSASPYVPNVLRDPCRPDRVRHGCGCRTMRVGPAGEGLSQVEGSSKAEELALASGALDDSLEHGSEGRSLRQYRIMADPIAFEPFPSSAFGEWIDRTRLNYIDERVAAGDSHAEAAANAHATIARLFPHGEPAPGQLVGQLISETQVVGYLWIGVADSDPQRWWVWDVMIDEQFRGQGLGRQAMTLAETLARRKAL